MANPLSRVVDGNSWHRVCEETVHALWEVEQVACELDYAFSFYFPEDVTDIIKVARDESVDTPTAYAYAQV